MNEKRPSSRLLADVLHEDWNHGPASGYARVAAAHARRRRRAARVVVAAATMAVAAAALVVMEFNPKPPAVALAVGKATVTFEIISDDQLLAQLHDQPLLVWPQKNGGKKIVLLDDKSGS